MCDLPKNKQKDGKEIDERGRPLLLRPFQSIQVDFTEMPGVGQQRYLLVTADHFIVWVEAFPLLTATEQGQSSN
jgi:hypothetical protein